MENIKHLRNQVSKLGLRASLCEPNRLTLRKKSNFLCRQEKFTQRFANQSLLVKASKFLLPHKHKSSSNYLIDEDFGTENNNYLDADSSQTFDLLPQINSNYYPYEPVNGIETVVSDTVPDILPTVNFVDNSVEEKKKTQPKSRKRTQPKSRKKTQPKSRKKTQTQTKSKPKAKKSSKKPKAIASSFETSEPVSPLTASSKNSQIPQIPSQIPEVNSTDLIQTTGETTTPE